MDRCALHTAFACVLQIEVHCRVNMTELVSSEPHHPIPSYCVTLPTYTAFPFALSCTFLCSVALVGIDLHPGALF